MGVNDLELSQLSVAGSLIRSIGAKSMSGF
jgi:hypothetical protein